MTAVEVIDDRIVVNGTPWSNWVEQGINGEWYVINGHQRSWADPLQGTDNVAGTGAATPVAAAVAYVSSIDAPTVQHEMCAVCGRRHNAYVECAR